MTPGWRVDHTGQWVEDTSTRQRHMPGKGTVPYRSNLAVRVYVTEDDGEQHRGVIDPRKLSGRWEEFLEVFQQRQQELKDAEEVAKGVRKALREAHHRPQATDAYQVQPGGSAVTVPIEDLRALVGLAASQLAGSAA
jgi:hypothetical protein